MKINIPKVTRPIRLSDYAPEFGEQVIEMWVNPPRDVRLEFARIADEFKAVRDALAAVEDADEAGELVQQITDLGQSIYAWYAQMWSQAGDEWTVEDVQEFANEALELDPALWDYVQETSLDLMQAYRRQKKASSPGPQG